jgi:hypothetical protein
VSLYANVNSRIVHLDDCEWACLIVDPENLELFDDLGKAMGFDYVPCGYSIGDYRERRERGDWRRYS